MKIQDIGFKLSGAELPMGDAGRMFNGGAGCPSSATPNT